MRFVALCYDFIRSDAMVPIVEAIVLIGEIFLAAKKIFHDQPGIGVGVNATLGVNIRVMFRKLKCFYFILESCMDFNVISSWLLFFYFFIGCRVLDSII